MHSFGPQIRRFWLAGPLLAGGAVLASIFFSPDGGRARRAARLPIEAPSAEARRQFAVDAVHHVTGHLANLDATPNPNSNGGAVRVAILKSALGQPSRLDDLTQNWSQYGNIPVTFDYTLASVSNFSESDVRSLDADVLLTLSPVADKMEFTNSEISILEGLQVEGTTLVAVGTVFGGQGFYDNTPMGHLWGLDTFNRVFELELLTQQEFQAREPGPNPLFNGLPTDVPFDIDPLGSERQVGRPWDDDQMAGASIEGHSPSWDAVETLFLQNIGPAIYLSAPFDVVTPGSDLPDGASDANAQLLYNALTYGRSASGAVSGNVQTDGTPFAGKKVILAAGPIGCDPDVFTDQFGEYEFDEVPEGTYSLEIPNILDTTGDSLQGAIDGVLIADGVIEVNDLAAQGIPVYAVRVDVTPFLFQGPVITDPSGAWSVTINPRQGKWVIWAPGIGVVAHNR